MWNNIHFLDDDTLDEVINQDKVSVVSFLLNDHLDCRRQATVICQMAAQYGTEYNFVVLDVINCPMSVERFGITDVPSMVFIRRGVALGGYNGVVKDDQREELEGRLSFMSKEPLEKQFPGYRLATDEEKGQGSDGVVRASAQEAAACASAR